MDKAGPGLSMTVWKGRARNICDCVDKLGVGMSVTAWTRHGGSGWGSADNLPRLSADLSCRRPIVLVLFGILLYI